MKILFYPLCVLGLSMMMMSCGSDANPSVQESAPKVVEKRCFQFAASGFNTSLNIEWLDNGRLGGDGHRYVSYGGKNFDFTIDGSWDEGTQTSDVIITLVDTKDPVFSVAAKERWAFDGDKLNMEGVVADNTTLPEVCMAREVSCKGDQSPKADSMYQKIDAYYEGYAVAEKDGKLTIIDEKGESQVDLPDNYIGLGSVNEGSIVFFDSETGRYGMLDVEGNVLLEAKYDHLHAFNQGLAAFLDGDSGKWGFLDREGNVAIKAEFMSLNINLEDDSKHPFDEEGVAAVTKDGTTWGYIDTKGKTVIDFKFSHANNFDKNGEAAVYTTNGKWQYIDRSGECIRDCD